MSIVSTMVIAATATGVMFGGNSQTTVGSIPQQENNYKKVAIFQENTGKSNQLKECLEKNGVTIKKYGNCNQTNLPENCPPITNKPETNLPGTNNPGSNNPGTNNPGTDKPEDDNITNGSYASQVVDLVNEERGKVGLNALAFDKKTSIAADVRAEEIKQSFSHTRPDGTSFTTVLAENGVTYKSAGENIAWGQRTPEEVVKAWMNSEGHRKNILNEKFTSIGVGYYENNGTAYWTQLFTS